MAALPVFLDELRNGGFNIGAEEYADAHTLMLKLARNGQLPPDHRKIGPLLSPLICSRPEEMREFAVHFRMWADGFRAEKEKGKAPEEEKHIRKLRFLSWVWIATLILLGVATFFLFVNVTGNGKNGVVKPPPVSTGSPVTAVAPAENREKASPPSRQFAPFYWMALAGLSLMLAVREIWLRYWVARYLRRRSAGAPFDVQPFYITAKAPSVFKTVGLRRAAQTMQRHHRAESAALDVPATVERSIRAGNRFSPVYEKRYHRPEYLVLVDRSAFRDHRADWADAILDYLTLNEVFIKRYVFDRDPRSCIPHSGDQTPLSLDELARRHPRHRLIVFSDGKGLLNPFTGEAADWVEQFFIWKNKALLRLDLENGDASFPARDFAVMPADEEGLLRLMEKWRRESEARRAVSADAGFLDRFSDLEEAVEQREVTADFLVDEVNRHLGGAGFFWLCACAVYPELGWRLTLHLQDELKKRHANMVFDRKLLKKMACLPWFRKGEIPDRLRLRLIEDDSFCGKREKEVRGILFDLIRTSAETGDIRLTHGTPDDRLIRRIMQAVRRLPKGRRDRLSPMKDQIFVEFMANPLSVRIPKEVRRFFKKRENGKKKKSEYSKNNFRLHVWSRIKFFFARNASNNTVEYYMMWRSPKKAASFLNAKYNELAPVEVRKAAGNYRLMRWNFMGATKYFLNECKPSSIVAILNEWYKGEPMNSFKPGIILNMMLTVPHMAFGMTEEEKKEKVDRIITLVTITNKALLKERFDRGPLNSLLVIFQNRDPEFVPSFIPFITFDIPERKLALLFFFLENQDPDWAAFLISKLPSYKALSILELMNTIKIRNAETEKKLKKTDSDVKKRTDTKEESLTD